MLLTLGKLRGRRSTSGCAWAVTAAFKKPRRLPFIRFLQMKREALQKLNRAANESAGVLGQAG